MGSDLAPLEASMARLEIRQLLRGNATGSVDITAGDAGSIKV
jgi:hypothetical protein